MRLIVFLVETSAWQESVDEVAKSIQSEARYCNEIKTSHICFAVNSLKRPKALIIYLDVPGS